MVTEQILRAFQHVFGNENAAGNGIYRSFHGTHILIEEQMIDSLLVQHMPDKGEINNIIGAQQFHHHATLLFGRPELAATGHACRSRAFTSILAEKTGEGWQLYGCRHSLWGQCRAPLPSLDALVGLVADDMDRVNDGILARAQSHVELIPELAGHLINSGGKRIRPMLTLAAARMCGYCGEHHIKLATAVEFMHTATLLHDDVVDESDLRRGKQAARVIWGNQASVLVGDYLLGQAFKMMVETGSLDCLRILSNAAAVIAEGEVLQLSVSQDTSTTEDAYLQVVGAKTAALFSAAAEVGGVIAGRPRDEQAALESYGRNLGIAFQLVDDALDYSGKQACSAKASATISANAKSPCPWCSPSGAAQRKNENSGSARWKTATRRMTI